MSCPPIPELDQSLPWIQDMKQCAQSPLHHAEGDVWTHTKLVRQELEKLLEFGFLSSGEQNLVRWAALLHDVGKPAATREAEDGELRSPKHALVGSKIARRILMDYGVPFKDREAICSLIRYHSAPIHCIDEAHRAIEISWKSQPHLLWVLAKADEKGRDTDCRERSGNEDLFRLLCEENNCFYNPYQFANKHARFLFFRNELSSLHYTPHESYRCTVYMMAGLPGSGKSTWRSKQNLPWVCLDELRRKLKVAPGDYPGELHMAAKEQCLDHLRKKQDFIFDATNLIKEHRGRWINLFAKYDSKVCCVYVEADWKQLLKQNQDREHKVPESVIDTMLDGMDMPCPTEFHEMKYIIGGTEL